jgi:hypothetical protein
MEENFTKQDIEFIAQRGNSLEKIEEQLRFLKNGIPKIILNRPATINDGIKSLSDDETLFYANLFDAKKENLKLKKFVPASGAASRMFKFLTEFLNEYKLGEESINAYINRKNDKNLSIFLIAKEKFPFHDELLLQLNSNYPDYHQWGNDSKAFAYIKMLLDANSFNYANKPKGVLPFHKYKDFTSTAIEEHLNECVFYATSNNKSRLHFTISNEHKSEFETIVNFVKPKIERRNSVKISVKYSFQDKSTDAIAVDYDNNPFRDENGNLLFRPGGHGALIENLNQLNADVIFIKNIDNVIQNHIQIIALYKKTLAGILIELQTKIYSILESIKSKSIKESDLKDILHFASSKLFIEIIDDFDKFTFENKINYIVYILNRPIRVCGMVKNEGEPGGGPFWVQGNKGKITLQIVESSQVDTKDKVQKNILENATHFNPVDIVCGIKDFEGNKFDLTKFVNTNRGFIVEKTKNGKPYKAFELPGLWNGAMAKWITIFVEVPLVTFNPVKTVNDLLKPTHQSVD